jgi:acetyl esterase/lipase
MFKLKIGNLLTGNSISSKIKRANKHHNGNVKVDRVIYGGGEEQYYLLFTPKEVTKKNVLFFVHGGEFTTGNPMQYRFIGHHFANQGYITVMPGYRHAPMNVYPSQLDDVFKVLTGAIKKIKERFDSDYKIILAGKSSGAYLASMLAYHKIKQLENDIDPQIFSGFLSISGPIDFDGCKNDQAKEMLENFIGGHYNWNKANPIAQLDGKENIPVLCLHGAKDEIVNTQSSSLFVKKINNGSRSIAEIFIEENKYNANHLGIDIFLENLTSTTHLNNWLEKIEN